MPDTARPASPRRDELLAAAYGYVLDHGLGDLSLRPLAAAISSSPRVLLYLFGSKDGLVRALLSRARDDELTLLARAAPGGDDLDAVVRTTWRWLAAPEHRRLLALWVEAYAASLARPAGPLADFARATVEDWLAILAAAPGAGDDPAAPTLALAVLRGALLDLLATGDIGRTTAAVERHLTPAPEG